MAEKEQFLGMTANLSIIIGRVAADPVYYTGKDGDCGFFYMRVENRQEDSNGQWVNVEVQIPVYCEHGGVVENLIKKHVKEGRQLYMQCYYKNWDDNGALMHGFFVVPGGIKLGLP